MENLGFYNDFTMKGKHVYNGYVLRSTVGFFNALIGQSLTVLSTPVGALSYERYLN
jgi:hypothetical protein